MAQPLNVRIAELERQMLSLQDLPVRMTGLETRMSALETRMGSLEAQFVQFRAEVKVEFSAVRAEMRQEIHDGNEETRRYMRILYEDLVERLKTLNRG